eukprot:CAMPEP_0206488648 /NCGR_PEP_ID=MMETSP0324_2-20121206/42582_1 /ASSEMBLY_ACC=CAM_ASM_000836 /TAXON_ID=2866 /ORGANISM="Crypthecodinium cohnii, Strain Seligo" /LENGTH=504 /DNA_ID=CAMNT_0053967801 /DNA_START=227 /DNA_END=1741 /DNA_ORIENTATION=-
MTEVRAGAIAWMTMSYIMVVNPVIICKAATPDNPLDPEAVMTSTALAASFGSLCAGLLGDAPLGLMPGMGLNAYFAFGICHTFGVSWQEALSCCLMSGIILVTFSVMGLCNYVVGKVLSEHLKKAITVAIGVFQALIGFQTMGLVVSSSDTLVTLGDLSLSNSHLYLAIAGFLLISALLVVGEVRGALLLGIWAMAVTAWALGLTDPPKGILDYPSFGSSISVSFDAWNPNDGNLPAMIAGTAVLLFVALFDLAGVQYGLMGMAGLLRDGNVPRSSSIFSSAGLATIAGALFGTSPIIIANESSAGIVEGAKTGLMAITVSVLFFFSAFIGPLLAAVPHVATAVPLVLIGAFMMAPCRGIDWENLRIALPSFLTMTVVPFTYSIHTGIIVGILMDFFLVAASKPFGKVVDPALIPSKEHTPLLGKGAVMTPHITPYMTMQVSIKDSKADLVKQLLAKLHSAQGGPPTTVLDCLEHHSGSLLDELEIRKDSDLRNALEAYLDDEI